MLSQQEAEQLIRSVPRETSTHDLRVAASVVTGVRDDKTLSEIIKYYWLSEEDAKRWWEFFGFDNLKQRERSKRIDKTSLLNEFVRSNIGKTLSVKDICNQLNISGPTFYSYFNSYRQHFKKVQHGYYMIIDPEEERKKQDSVD